MSTQRPRQTRLLDVVLVGLVLLGAVLSACGRARSDSDGGSASKPNGADLDLPADQIVWQVEQSGVGPITDVAHAARRPSITIYGDGRIFLVQPAQDPRYDQPLSLRSGRVDPDMVAAFLEDVEDGGLLDPDADPAEVFGRPETPDLSTTHVTFRGRDGAHDLSVYGLGGRFDPEVAEDQADRREELRMLLHDAEALLEVPEPYTPERVRVLRLPDDATFEEPPEDDDADEVPDWPGPDPDTFLRDMSGVPQDTTAIACGELEGDAAVDLIETASDNPSPHWLVDDEQMTLVIVGLLPGETACP